MTDGEPAHPTGLIVGRFDPPHLGHSFMIDRAAEQVSELVVYVNSSPSRDAIDGELRARWLGERHPDVRVLAVHHRLPTDWDDQELWAKWIALFRDHWPHDDGPHAVFSSDHYVGGIAERLGAVPELVDPARATIPISATQIRDDPAAHLDLVLPEVRRWIESNWL